MTSPSVFSIPASLPFAKMLAKGLMERIGTDPLALCETVIYVPTRRAARGFGQAFAELAGGATLLPQFKALGDVDEDELVFDAASVNLELTPAINPLRRQLLLAWLVRRWDQRAREACMSFAQAAALGESLAQLLDELEMQHKDLSAIADLAPDEMAEHWQKIAGLLDLLGQEWPRILKSEGAINPGAHRTMALDFLAERLAQAPPSTMVIAAGSTGSIPATARLLSVIARLPKGHVIVPGLDQTLDARAWEQIGEDPGHPQYGLHQLLKIIDVMRSDVGEWYRAPEDAARETLLSEALRPAPTTDAWRGLAEKGGHDIQNGLKGLSLLKAANPQQEALSIALALRECLETPGRTGALVTPDRNLARRVAAQMNRWAIAIDDSAGRPLAHTSAGAFLNLILQAAQNRFAPISLLALLKHPFALNGQDSAFFRARARELDRWCLRGPRPDPGLEGIAKAIENAKEARHGPPAHALERLSAWWRAIAEILKPLEDLFSQSHAPLKTLLTRQLEIAERLSREASGSFLVWQARDGECAWELAAALGAAAEDLPEIEPHSWPPLFSNLTMKIAVRSDMGRHPRLAILGPLEARLQDFDLTILGGLNEGTWPQSAGNDPWFSRPMRRRLGLEQPERSIGRAAHDFSMLAQKGEVLLTRSLKDQGTPTIASRWLQRLEQLIGGLQKSSPELAVALKGALACRCDYCEIASALMDAKPQKRFLRPSPRPVVAARPRKLSVTEIETWLRDPYAIYARHVLNLRPLDRLDEAVGPLERGNALHKVLEIFMRRFPKELPPQSLKELANITDEVFAGARIPKAAIAIWRPRFLAAAGGLLSFERERRLAMTHSHLETRGTRVLIAPHGAFTLTGIADRIDILKDGSASILDYKTGTVPSAVQVTQLLSPQLPLEGAILMEGGFAGVEKCMPSELMYINLSSQTAAANPSPICDAQALSQRAWEKLGERVAVFDDKNTPYYSHVMPLYADSVGAYDHLARVREWSAWQGEDRSHG